MTTAVPPNVRALVAALLDTKEVDASKVTRVCQEFSWSVVPTLDDGQRFLAQLKTVVPIRVLRKIALGFSDVPAPNSPPRKRSRSTAFDEGFAAGRKEADAAHKWDTFRKLLVRALITTKMNTIMGVIPEGVAEEMRELLDAFDATRQSGVA